MLIRAQLKSYARALTLGAVAAGTAQVHAQDGSEGIETVAAVNGAAPLVSGASLCSMV